MTFPDLLPKQNKSYLMSWYFLLRELAVVQGLEWVWSRSKNGTESLNTIDQSSVMQNEGAGSFRGRFLYQVNHWTGRSDWNQLFWNSGTWPVGECFISEWHAFRQTIPTLNKQQSAIPEEWEDQIFIIPCYSYFNTQNIYFSTTTKN